MKLPFQIDLTGKVVVVTGAGGVICSVLAEAMAMTGAKVALLDLNEDAAKKHADDITAKGYIAKGYKCNVLEKASVQAARDQIAADFGTCDILINGAGGNNPKATTDDEYFVPEDLGQMKTFFDLDADGVSFVFSLNFMGTLIPTQVFALDMVNKKRCEHHQYFLDERLHTVDEDSGILRCKSCNFQLYRMACSAFFQGGYPLQRDRTGIFLHTAECKASVQ